MRSRRLAERFKKEAKHFQDLSASQARRIEQLEEDAIRTESLMEQRQIDWEVREVELEGIQLVQPDDVDAKARPGEGEPGPKPSVSLSQQLQHALEHNR